MYLFIKVKETFQNTFKAVLKLNIPAVADPEGIRGGVKRTPSWA